MLERKLGFLGFAIVLAFQIIHMKSVLVFVYEAQVWVRIHGMPKTQKVGYDDQGTLI